MKKALFAFLLAVSVLNVNQSWAADAQSPDDESKSQSSDTSSDDNSGPQSQAPSDPKSKVEVRPGMDVEARAKSGVNAGGGDVKVAPKGTAEAKAEPYIAVGNKSFDVKVKAGATLQGQATTEDVKTGDHRDKSDAAIGVHGGLAVESKNGILKGEVKGGHFWTAGSGQYNFLSGVLGACTSPGQKNEKYQLCGNAFYTKKFFETYKANEVGGELLIQKQTDGGTRIFGGARYAYEKSDSGAPDTHFTGLTIGINTDLNAGAVRASKK